MGTPLTFVFGKVFEGYSLWHAYNNPERRDAVARLYIPSWKQYRMNDKKNIYLRNSTYKGVYAYWKSTVHLDGSRLDIEKLEGNTDEPDLWISQTKAEFDHGIR